MKWRALAIWTLAGLAGLAIAAGLTYAASQLASQPVGLTSEPLSAGEDLAPGPARSTPTATPTPTPAKRRPRRTPTPTPDATRAATPAATPVTAPSVEAGDDSGGSGKGRGRGRGRGGDD
jgi:hypothetical protein